MFNCEVTEPFESYQATFDFNVLNQITTWINCLLLPEFAILRFLCVFEEFDELNNTWQKDSSKEKNYFCDVVCWQTCFSIFSKVSILVSNFCHFDFWVKREWACCKRYPPPSASFPFLRKTWLFALTSKAHKRRVICQASTPFYFHYWDKVKPSLSTLMISKSNHMYLSTFKTVKRGKRQQQKHLPHSYVMLILCFMDQMSYYFCVGPNTTGIM